MTMNQELASAVATVDESLKTNFPDVRFRVKVYMGDQPVIVVRWNHGPDATAVLAACQSLCPYRVRADRRATQPWKPQSPSLIPMECIHRELAETLDELTDNEL